MAEIVDGIKLTRKQRIFCEEYIANGGNATKAALSAGYKKSSAYSTGIDNLKKPVIKEYLQKLVAPDDKKRKATAEEVIQYLTSVVRRELQEYQVITIKDNQKYYDDEGHKITKYSETPTTVGIPARLSDANKAAELLGKYMGLWDGQGREQIKNEILESLVKMMERHNA